MHNNIKILTLKNIGYNASSRIIVFSLSAVASVILARNLEPSDYGVVGFALIIIGFFSRFSDLGINSAVIQKSNLDSIDLYTGFTIKFLLGFCLFAITFAIAPLSIYFLDHPATSTVIRVLALNFIISSFTFLPSCLLTRELNYRRLLIPQMGAAIINSLLSIIMALSGFKFWSIVLANIMSSVISVLLFNLVKPINYKFSINKRVLRISLDSEGTYFLQG